MQQQRIARLNATFKAQRLHPRAAFRAQMPRTRDHPHPGLTRLQNQANAFGKLAKAAEDAACLQRRAQDGLGARFHQHRHNPRADQLIGQQPHQRPLPRQHHLARGHHARCLQRNLRRPPHSSRRAESSPEWA
jgi:hypothetical protein